jgi:hypothetical protein
MNMENLQLNSNNPLDPNVIAAQAKASLSNKKPVAGLGDIVHKVAQPIARAIDKVAGTNIQGCGACQKRKEYLNEKFPNT